MNTTDRARIRTQWRLLHSYLVDGVLAQEPDESKGLQMVLGGMRSLDFITAVRDGSRVRVRPLREDDGTIAFRVEVLDDYGRWQGVTRPPAHVLGISPDEAEAALVEWLGGNRDFGVPDPDDAA